MSLKVYKSLEQRSERWYEARCGIVTASVMNRLVTQRSASAETVPCPKCGVEVGACVSLARKTPVPLKNVHPERTAAAGALPKWIVAAEGDEVATLTNTLVAERITGFVDPTFQSVDMFRGTTEEPIARDVYSGHHAAVEECGFMVRDDWGYKIGYSPDGLVGSDGLIEIKCPRQKEHLRTILADEVPAQYMAQIQTGLLVSGRSWCDYVSFYGGMPLWTKRVHADQRWADAIVHAAGLFEGRAKQMVAQYRASVRGLPITERIPDLYAAELRL